MKESCLVPSHDFPSTEWKGRAKNNWLWDFEREKFLSKGGHPKYGEKDVEYCFNSHGYRTGEFNVSEGIKIVSIGCSHVFGYALPQNEIFSEVISKKISEELGIPVTHWNLGFNGGSNDYISRTLQLVVPRLNPDLVIVNFTWSARREYIAANEETYHYLPGLVPHWSPVLKDCYRHLSGLASTPDDQLNFFRNYKSIEQLLDDRYWFFSANDIRIPKLIEHHLDWNRYVGSFSSAKEPDDIARDHLHPGGGTHLNLAALYLEKLRESNVLAAFAKMGSN